MQDMAFQIGSTVAALLVFVLLMIAAESLPVPSNWGVLAALALFVLISSGIGVLIAQRSY